MCDTTEGPSWYHVDKRRARKRHRCYACRETILPRETYVRCIGVWSGDLDVYIHCERCHALYQVLVHREDLRFLDVGVPLDLRCGLLADPDDPAQWLAFALAGDPELAQPLDSEGRPRME